MGAQSGESTRGAPVELQLRWASLAHNLDPAPEHLLGVSGAKRLHGGFLRGKPAGKVNGGHAAAGAVGNFAFGEHAREKPVAIPRDDVRDAGDVRRVESEADDV